jgi:nitroimidazol reductase NimA-like FMN-containing flavoprotein (pyridoxamine 5'-phosphate oxidase superfamily)
MMSNKAILQAVDQYTNETPLGVLSYLRSDHVPVQRTFGAFAKVGNDILLTTQKDAAKVAALHEHPLVSFFVEKKDQSSDVWKSALFIGSVQEITDKAEFDKTVEIISARNEFIRQRVLDGGASSFTFFRLTTSEIEWLDYEQGHGHVDHIKL